MTGLIEHYELSLGPIRAGWTVDANGVRLPFQIVQFDGGPIEDMGTLVTLGYSNYRLRLAHSRIRQELMLFARPKLTDPLVCLLHSTHSSFHGDPARVVGGHGATTDAETEGDG